MSDALQFDLPPATGTARSRPWWLIAVATFAVGGVTGYFFAPHDASKLMESGAALAPTPSHADALLTAQEQHDLAERLERNQLYAQAAHAWLAATRLNPPEETKRADRMFRIGKNFALAGRHEEALRYFFAAEAAGADDAVKSRIHARVLEGFTALGLEDVRDYQTLKRASLNNNRPTSQPIDDEVARIGNEILTERDLRAFARQRLERQLSPQRGFLSDEAFESAVASAVEAMDTPDGKTQFLQSYLRDELLYREALAHNMPDRPEVRAEIVDARRAVLIQAFLTYYLSQSVQIDEAGIQDAYEANKDQYIEPEAILLAAIVVGDEEAKGKVDAAIGDSVDFETARQEHSTEQPDTGLNERWYARDSVLPGVDDPRAALAHLFTLGAGQVSNRWFEASGRWHRYRVQERRDQRQLALEECRDRVERDLRTRKQRAAVETLQQTLAAKYKVTLPDAKASQEP